MIWPFKKKEPSVSMPVKINKMHLLVHVDLIIAGNSQQIRVLTHSDLEKNPIMIREVAGRIELLLQKLRTKEREFAFL